MNFHIQLTLPQLLSDIYYLRNHFSHKTSEFPMDKIVVNNLDLN
jgi:hypothetical protein